MNALLVVAHQYHLNPFTREIYAFQDKGGIVPIVGIDGWCRIVNECPAFDGVEFLYSSEKITIDESQRVPAHEWIEAVFYRKGMSRPFRVREYLLECYRPPFRSKDGKLVPGPWQSHPNRFLRHRAYIQGARYAFGFAGLTVDIGDGGVMDIEVGAETVQAQERPSALPQVMAKAIAMGANEKQFLSFLTATAEGNDTSLEELSAYARKDQSNMDSLYSSFLEWSKPERMDAGKSAKTDGQAQQRRRRNKFPKDGGGLVSTCGIEPDQIAFITESMQKYQTVMDEVGIFMEQNDIPGGDLTFLRQEEALSLIDTIDRIISVGTGQDKPAPTTADATDGAETGVEALSGFLECMQTGQPVSEQFCQTKCQEVDCDRHPANRGQE